MAQVPEGLLEELHGRLEELAVETSGCSGGLEAVTVAVEGLTFSLSAFEVDAVHLAVLDPDLATADPVSALVAGAVGLRLTTELDLIRHRVGDPTAVAALAHAVALGQRVRDALAIVAREFAEAGEREAGEQVAGAASALADVLVRARRVAGGALAADDDTVAEAVPQAPPSPWFGVVVAAAVTVVLVGLAVGYSLHRWPARVPDLPALAVEDFATLAVVTQVVNRPPAVLVVVSDDGWQGLSGKGRQAVIDAVAERAAAAGYDRAEIRSPSRQGLATWVDGGAATVAE